MCRVSWNLGASTSWNPQGLPRPVLELLYLYCQAAHNCDLPLLRQSWNNSCILNDSSLLRYSTCVCLTLILYFLLSPMYIANRNKNKRKPTVFLIKLRTVTVAWGQFNLGSYWLNMTNIPNEIHHVLLISKNLLAIQKWYVTWISFIFRFNNVLKFIVFSIQFCVSPELV